jgi:hypothetical protein
MPEFRASFRVMKKDLDPSEVSRVLGLTPDYCHTQGDPRIGKSGRRYSDFSEGFWELKSNLDMSEPLTAHLAKLVGILRNHDAALIQLRELNHEMDIFVGVFDEGGNAMFTLDNDVIQTLSSLRLDVTFDVYP